jgi:UDPglucose--hexose-1-phosphate uridylyltransferase
VLGARDDVDYVLIFENRGHDAGATISHAHGQIYAFDFVPELPRHQLTSGISPIQEDPGDRLVSDADGWRAWVPEAAIFPFAVRIAPEQAVPDLPSLDGGGRDGLAALLVDVLERFDRAFDTQTPYMLWVHQRPFDGRGWPSASLYVEVVSPWRARGVMRYIAAGEIGSGVYFNPVAPEVAAQTLRDAIAPLRADPDMSRA